MRKQLAVTLGQHSSAGRKPINQDFHATRIPSEPLLTSKGIAVALADGISTSTVSQLASQSAVSSFLDDYYCTSDAWSVKTSGQKVLAAVNSWLCSQTQGSPYRFDKDRGYVCTFSAVIFKSNTAHIFHVGDARVYRVAGNQLEQLTQDHRRFISEQDSYLTRALGIHSILDLDYTSFAVEEQDVFVLTTDGVYEYLEAKTIVHIIEEHRDVLDRAAQQIIQSALAAGSQDNLTIQIVRIDSLPDHRLDEVHQQIDSLALPPTLAPRMQFDGFDILREIYISSRSHVFLARDRDTDEQVVIKTPSREMRADTAYLETLLTEEWIARRINNAHVLKAKIPPRKRKYLYLVTEFIEGETLAQWMIDHPAPKIEEVRNIIEQVAKGLLAFHRQEMLHQDLRPKNIMIDNTGTVKIIDFGATRVAGITELRAKSSTQAIVGTAQYTAPEYFIGELAGPQADIFSLGVIAYQMLCGKMPYGTVIAKLYTRRDLHKLNYHSLRLERPEIPEWVDVAIKKAVRPEAIKRYEEVSEFVYDLSHPNKTYLDKTRPPLIDRNPVLFWQCVALILLVICIIQAVYP